jgi:nitrogen fixation-related uncharacterized protein
MNFLEVWVMYAIFGITLFSAVFVWAVRARQFTDLDKGRYIALRTEDTERGDRPETPAKVDSLTLLFIVFIALALFLSAIWLGYMVGRT